MLLGHVRLGRAAALCGVLVGAAFATPPGHETGHGAAAGATDVVVRGQGDEAALRRAVDQAGGRVTAALPIISGVAATVPAAEVSRLSSAPGVAEVYADAPV